MLTPSEIGPFPIALTVVAAPVYLFCVVTRQDRPVALGASSFHLGVFITAAVAARYLDGYPYLASFLAVEVIAAALTGVLFVLGKRLSPNPTWLPPIPSEPTHLEGLRGSVNAAVLILFFLNVLNYFIGPKPTCLHKYSSYSTMKCIGSHQRWGSENSLFFAFYLDGGLICFFLILTVLGIVQLTRHAYVVKRQRNAAARNDPTG